MKCNVVTHMKKQTILLILVGAIFLFSFINVVHSKSIQSRQIILYPIYDIVGRSYSDPIGSDGEKQQTKEAIELYKRGVR